MNRVLDQNGIVGRTTQPGPSSFVVRSGVDAKTTRPQQELTPELTPELPPELPPELDLCTGKMPAAPPETPNDEQILVAVATNMSPAADIARASGISILELTRIVTRPENLKQLQQVTQLHAIEREMMLGSLKRKALVRLGELTDEVGAMNANEVRACEVMRKACVDILRVGAPGSAPTRNPSPTPPRNDPPEPLNEEKILEALERWGEKIEEQEEEYPQISQMGRGGFKSGSVEQVPWSKAEPQAMSVGRDGVRGVEVTDEVQVGMAFGKTSDHGTGLPPMASDMNMIPRQTRYHVRVPEMSTTPETTIRTGKMPEPPKSPLGVSEESRLPNDPGSRNGPGETGGGDSGSYSRSTRDPIHKPRPPPIVNCSLPVSHYHDASMSHLSLPYLLIAINRIWLRAA